MGEAVYVGRPRPLWKIILYQMVTFGVYGRVYLFRTAKELDGHSLFFLDHKLFLLGVILPFGGPLVVKWNLLRLLPETLRHDVTARPVNVRAMQWAAFIPWLPVFHVFFQRHLDPHWERHRKEADLAALAAILEEKRGKARSKAALEEVDALEKDVRERRRSLKLADEAAHALREAERARERARRETEAALRAARPPIWSPKRWIPGRQKKEIVAVPEDADVAAPETEPAPMEEKRPRFGFLGRKKEEPASEAATAELAPVPPADPQRPLTRKERKALERAESEPAATPSPPEATPGVASEAETKPSRKERKALKKAEKARRKQEKKDAKLAKKEAKRLAKAERREAKRQKAEEKARAKTEAREAQGAAIAEAPLSETAPPEAVSPEPEFVAEPETEASPKPRAKSNLRKAKKK